jgi:hypothetical protein
MKNKISLLGFWLGLFFLILTPSGVSAASYVLGSDGYYYMSEEAHLEYLNFIRSLPHYVPSGVIKAPGDQKTDLLDYVGYPRDQGSLGLCWAFAMTGMLEVQHEVNCAICSGELSGDCPDPVGLCGHCPEGEFFPLHLSLQTFLECTGPDLLIWGATGPVWLGEFLTTYGGLPYESLQPYEFAEDTGYDMLGDRFRFICPMMDRVLGRHCPDFSEEDGDGICDLKNISEEMDIPLDFFKVTGEFESVGTDPSMGYSATPIEALDDNRIVGTTALWCVNKDYPFIECDLASCPPEPEWHAMIMIGYIWYEGSLYYILRNSHKEPGPIVWEAGNAELCSLGKDGHVINGPTEGYQEPTGCPSAWIDADPDLDGLANIVDRCRFSENVSNELDDDCDFWPQDIDATQEGCDNCPFIKNSYQLDLDKDEWGGVCDNCPGLYNPSQSNCNYFYEVLHGFADPGTPDLEGELGDACDPDPCVSTCSEPNRNGECGPETEPWIYPSGSMFDLFTGMGNQYGVDYFAKGYSLGPDGSPIEGPRDELMQIHWCSCKVIDGPGWMSDDVCKATYCFENGRANPDPYLKTGWFGTILQDRPVAAKTIDDVTVYESVPFNTPFQRDSRGIEREVILWRDSSLQYPAGTPTDENYLRFWLRPINRDHYISTSEEEKRPPSSERFEGFPPQDWNNTYIPKTYLHYTESGLGRDIIIAQQGRWVNVPWIDRSTKKHPGVVKLEEWMPWLKDEECGSPWDYVQQPPGSALTGIAFMKVEPWRMGIPEILPSQAAVNEVPGEKGMAFARMSWEGAVAPLAATFVAFGGVNAAGEYSSALWTAERHGPAVGEPGDQEPLFLWRRVNGYEGLRPEGRSTPAIFTIPGSQEIFVYAGQGETGYLGDLWAFSPGIVAPYADGMTAAEAVADGGGTWSLVQTFGDVPSLRARFSTVQMNNEVYIYGGHTVGGVSGELFLLHLPEGRFEMIYPEFSSPGPRAGASLAINPGGVLFLFGGYDGAAFRNDLWAFDLGNRSWVEIMPDCFSGSCPPALDWPTLIRDQWSGSLAVFTSMASVGGDLYWVPTDRGWVGQRFIEGTPDAGDCDGDGTEDASFGQLCPTGDEWWSYPGRMLCDTWEPAVACSPSDVSGGEASRIHLPSARSFDVEGSMLCAAHDAKLSCYDLTDPSSPSLAGSLTLHRTAWGVDVVGNFAYVAADREILAVDISDPSSPFVTSHMPTCGTAFDVEVEDDVLTFVSSGGLGAAYIARPGELAGAGFLWISRHGGSIETEIGSMQQCAELSWWEQALIDMRAFLGGIGFPRADLLERRVYISSGRNVMVIGVESPIKPELVGTYALSLPVQDLRIDGDLLYLNLAAWQGRTASRIVLDVSDPTSIFEAGTHDVTTWVRGLLLEGNKAFILDKPHIKIAEVYIPPGGW